jgi:hypothetical protein
VKNLSETWLQGKGPLPIGLTLSIFAGLLGPFGTIGTRLVLSTSFQSPCLTSSILHYYSLQKWSVLLKEEDRQRIMQMKGKILSWMKNFKSSVLVTTDICEI